MALALGVPLVRQSLSMIGLMSSGKLLTAEEHPSQCHGMAVRVASFVVGRLMNWLRHLEYTTNLLAAILYDRAAS
jgi:hypothetical protein